MHKVLGVSIANVSAVRNSAGNITVTFATPTGIAIEFAIVTPVSAVKSSVSFSAGSNVITVLTDSNDVSFFLVVY